MQSTGTTQTPSMRVVVYHDGFEFGNAVQESLKKRCGEPKQIDSNRGLYHQFLLRNQDLNVTIDVVSNWGTNQHMRLLPKENETPDLLVVFSRCVAINKNYRIGDLVIVDQPDSASLVKKLQKHSEGCFNAMAKELPD